ncbi:hypothetical protein RIF23_14750 [Lipingzhangella sp. LS1_29]|uniref:FtsK domain-containing protein n=1 Tax=Lipingzhangella rawalii TaxID=2055835 RepID=A0ABU2H8C4_9ACTN|nr:hypothetical protein [Lipingzhangella rawalii]MDS1271556.1 hypothetical protein [Lipingzhangella rawalii]
MSTTTAAPGRPQSTKTTKDKKRRQRWSHQQGPALGAVNAASAALAVASVGTLPEVGLDWWWPAAAGAVGATASVTRSATSGQPWGARIFRGARWVGYTGWTAATLATGGPWDLTTLGILAGGTTAAAVLQPVFRSYEIAAQDRQQAEDRIRTRRGLAGAWEARINRICKFAKPGVRVTDIAEWNMPDPHSTEPDATRQTGMSIVVELPAGGGSWKTLAAKSEELASDADLPDGCGIEVASHGSRRRVVLFVSQVDALAEDIPAGDDYSPLSIYDDMPVGMYRTGDYAHINLKWSAAALIGATGSGKSAHLSLVMRQLLRCTDTIVMGIDFNGGKAFKPFLQPWLDGRTSKPAIDWVATTEKEAKKMLDFLLRANEVRSHRYSDLMAQVNDDKVPSTPAIPHVTVITDETADLPMSVKNKLVELSNRSRGASIRPLTCALRAVSEGGQQVPKPLLAQASVRTAMRVNEDDELRRLFGYVRGLPKADEMPEPGYGLIQPHPSTPPRIFRGFLVKPSDSDDVAVATDERRPVLDEATINAGRDDYTKRWQRAHEAGWLGTKPPAAPRNEPRPPQPPPVEETAERPLSLRLDEIDLKGAAQKARQRRQELEEKNRETGIDRCEIDVAFDELTADLEPAHGSGTVPRILEIALEQATDRGVHTKVLENATGLPATQIRDLLEQIGLTPADPFRMHPGADAAKNRGYLRSALDRVAAEIHLGDTQVPPEVRDAL